MLGLINVSETLQIESMVKQKRNESCTAKHVFFVVVIPKEGLACGAPPVVLLVRHQLLICNLQPTQITCGEISLITLPAVHHL